MHRLLGLSRDYVLVAGSFSWKLGIRLEIYLLEVDLLAARPNNLQKLPFLSKQARELLFMAKLGNLWLQSPRVVDVKEKLQVFLLTPS